MRRRTLFTLTGGVVATMAGCLSGGVPAADDTRGDDTTLPTRIDTVDTDCAGPDAEWTTAHRSATEMRIEGVMPAPHPCHLATVTDVQLTEGNLSVTIDADVSLGPHEECIACHGAVRYDLTIAVGDREVDRVTVMHSYGDTHEVTPLDDPEVDIASITIETVGTDCSAGNDDEIAVSREGATLMIDGVRPAPTPCYRAEVTASEIIDRTVVLAVDVASTLEPGDVCIECVGRVDYELQVDLEGPPLIEQVRVEHVDAGTHEVSLLGSS